MFLSELPAGESGVIVKVKGRGAFRRRIMEMGFVRGKEVRMVKNAPLLDPIQYSLMGYEVSLRKNEAALVEIVTTAAKKENLEIPQSLPAYDGVGFQPRTDFRNDHISVAFVGNPNCGKTTLFNSLSRSSEKVGNYAGVTIESKSASIEVNGYTIDFMDLPGTYSLSAYTPEERYVLNHIIEAMPDVVVNVIDGSNLERNMYLTTQLIDLDQRVIIALNMFDELSDRGDQIDLHSLGLLLGMPIVPTIGTRGKGLDKLLEKIVEVYRDQDPTIRHIHIRYGEEMDRSLLKVQEKIKQSPNYSITDKVSSRFLALRLIEGDSMVQRMIDTAFNKSEIMDQARLEKERIGKILGTEPESVITDAKYGFIDGALKETYKAGNLQDKARSSRIDSYLTDKYLGFPIFFVFLFIMFQGTFTLGKFPVALIESGVAWLAGSTERIMDPGPLKDLLIHGVIDGVGGVIVFLPNILILFLFIAFMEDTGYMARAAFMMDRLMHKIGLHGRSFIPLIMGFGCNVPAIMATRTIENRNNRILTMLINPFMSCSARLPVYVLLIGAFFPHHPGLILFSLYSVGILLAILVAIVFKNVFFNANDLPFVMELPPYRMPTFQAIVKHMWNRAGQYLRKMGGIILVASILIWALSYYPHEKESASQTGSMSNIGINDGNKPDYSDIRTVGVQSQPQILPVRLVNNDSYISRIGRFIEPVLRPLGFDWRLGISLLTGIAGKEIVVSTMGVIFQADEGHSSTASLTTKLQEARWTGGPSVGAPLFTKATAISYLLFILIYFPCIAVVAAVKNESGSWKWASFLVVYTTLLAWFVAFGWTWIVHLL